MTALLYLAILSILYAGSTADQCSYRGNIPFVFGGGVYYSYLYCDRCCDNRHFTSKRGTKDVCCEDATLTGNSEGDGGLSVGALIGIVISAIIAVGLIIFVISCWRGYKKSQSHNSTGPQAPDEASVFYRSLGATCYYNSFYSFRLQSKYCYRCCNSGYYTTSYGTTGLCCDSDSLPLWAILIISGVCLVIGSSVLIIIIKVCCQSCQPIKGGVVGQQPHVAVVSVPHNQQYYGYQGQVAPPPPGAAQPIPGAVY